jgi:thioredoxin-like negative regulator of GroEL
MNAAQIDTSLLRLLADVFLLGVDARTPQEALAVVQVLRAARPASPEFAIAEALQMMANGDRPGARHLLEDADARCPGHAHVKAVLALALFVEGDSLWQECVRQVRHLPPHGKARAIVDAVESMSNGEPAALQADTAAAGDETVAPCMPFPYLGVRC